MGGEGWPREEDGGGEAWAWRALIGGVLKRAVVLSAIITGAVALGAFHWTFELATHFVAWYAVASLLLTIGCGLNRMPRWAFAGLALFLIQACLPLSTYVPVAQPTNEGTVPITLLLANVLSSNQDHAALLALIAAEDPDVICVQEVSASWAESLSALEAQYPFHHAVPRNDNFGIALYSRVSVHAPTVLFDDEFGVPALSVLLERGSRRAHLLSLHTLPPLGQRYAERRSAQLHAAREWSDGRDVPVVLLGDLNTTMYSPVYRGLLSGATLKNARQGFGPLGTWPAFVPFLRLPLDHCIVSQAIVVQGCRLGPDIGSDHLPLLVELGI